MIQTLGSTIHETVLEPSLHLAEKVWNFVTAIFKRAIEPLVGYFLKVALFRDAILQSGYSKWVIAPLARGVLNLWMRVQGGEPAYQALDPERLKKSADFLCKFGKLQQAKTKDGTSLTWAVYTPNDFDQWIKDHGGQRNGDLIEPCTPADWNTLQCLREFKCFKEEGQAFKVPPRIPVGAKKCVLRCQGFGRTIEMDKAMIGLHLAAGFNYAIFNWRDEISVEGFFEDAETIYQELIKEAFTGKDIKPMGSCRATFVAAHLKELHHKEGLEVVMVHPPSSLQAIVDNAAWPANKIGSLGIGAIEKADADFNNVKKFEKLPKNNTATCVIISEGDRTIPNTDSQKLIEVAKSIGDCTVICEPKAESKTDPHFGDPFRDPSVLKEYFAFLLR
jgi:hypothetical protein